MVVILIIFYEQYGEQICVYKSCASFQYLRMKSEILNKKLAMYGFFFKNTLIRLKELLKM